MRLSAAPKELHGQNHAGTPFQQTETVPINSAGRKRKSSCPRWCKTKEEGSGTGKVTDI